MMASWDVLVARLDNGTRGWGAIGLCCLGHCAAFWCVHTLALALPWWKCVEVWWANGRCPSGADKVLEMMSPFLTDLLPKTSRLAWPHQLAAKVRVRFMVMVWYG